MIYIEEALEKFKKLPPDIILEVDSDRVAGIMAELEKKHGVSLSALVIYVTVGELMMDDIEGYLKAEFGLGDIAAKAVRYDLEEQIFKPVVRRLHFFDNDPRKDSITFKEEKELAEAIFEQDLIRDLENNPIIIEAINERIFYILSRELGFRKVIEDALYRNRQELTRKIFMLGGKPHAPTVSNWLSDFIEWHGTKMFDSVVISQYLIVSPNAKELDESEKEAVTKLLELYRNIKFFPESMPSDDGTGWEIIPLEESGEELDKARPVSGPPKTEEEREIDELKEEESRYGDGSLEYEAIEEEIGRRRKADRLRAVAARYKDGSLERKAIEEEIGKLEAGSNK